VSLRNTVCGDLKYMKEKKAIFQSEVCRHNGILLMDASSEVDMNKKKLWKALCSAEELMNLSKKETFTCRAGNSF